MNGRFQKARVRRACCRKTLLRSLGGGGIDRRRRRVVVGGAQGLHAPVGGITVEEEQQGEQDCSAHGGDNPKPNLPSGEGYQQRQGRSSDRRAHAAKGLLDADSNAEFHLEPGGDGGGNVDGEESLRQSQQQAIVDVKLPELVHRAEEQHPGHVEGGCNKQSLARAVAVTKPS